ncbi:hypothetical protein Aduo_017026 [Ancylostoma duodenale]
MRIPTMMHCMESLPQHLRVYGLTIMFATGVIFNMWLILFAKLVHYSHLWIHSMIALCISVTCFLHVRFAPPNIMHTLFEAESSVLHEKLIKWAPKGELMNIDSLIDYILYRGPVFTSQMSTFTHLLSFGPLVRKAVICAALLPLGSLIYSAGNAYVEERLSFGIYEADFISDMTSILGLFLSAYLCSRYGRRLPLAITLTIAILCQVILLNIRMELYNACKKMNSPEGWRATLALLTYLCAMTSSTVLLMIPRVILMEHVPTSLRSIVPLAFLFGNVIVLVRIGLQFLATRLPAAYPNAALIYSLGYTLFVAPFALLLDNSAHLPINIAEIPAYTPRREDFPTDIEPSDTPSEHFSVRMMLQACAAAEESKLRARSAEKTPMPD